MLPPSPVTDPDVRISRIRFFAEELRSGGVPVNDLDGGEWMGCEERAEVAPERWDDWVYNAKRELRILATSKAQKRQVNPRQ